MNSALAVLERREKEWSHAWSYFLQKQEKRDERQAALDRKQEALDQFLCALRDAERVVSRRQLKVEQLERAASERPNVGELLEQLKIEKNALEFLNA